MLVNKAHEDSSRITSVCIGIFLLLCSVGNIPDARDSLESREAERDSSGMDSLLMSKLSELEKLPILLVRCSFNNTYVNICDHTGKLITWKSAVSRLFLAW